MGIKTGVKRKTINNSETPNKLRKTDGAFNQKTPNKSHNTPAKNKKTAQTINAIKSPKTYTRKQKKSQKKNKHNPEDEQSEPESEEDVEVNLNEESGSDESLKDSKVVNVDEQLLDANEQNENEKEDKQNDSDEDSDAEEVMKQPNPKKQTYLDGCKFSVFVNGLRGANLQVPDIFKDCNHKYYSMIKDKTNGKYTGEAIVDFYEEENYKKALKKNGTVINGVKISVSPKRDESKRKELLRLKALEWQLNMDIKKLEITIGNKPVFKKNSNKPFKKNTNKVFVKKNTNKTFAKKKINPKK